MEELDPSLYECGVDVVLCSRVGLLELLLSGEARGTERRVHQDHVESRPREVDQGDALRSITREQSPARVPSTCRLREVPKRGEDPILGFVEDRVIRNAR